MPKQLLSKNLRWTDVEELNLPQDDEGYYLDADGDPINHKGNFSLRGSNIKIGYTKEMIQEIHKCRESIIYFVNNYVQATTQKGYKHITLYKYQKEILRDFEENYKVVLMMPRQMSKCIFKDTKLSLNNSITSEKKEQSVEDLFLETKREFIENKV